MASCDDRSSKGEGVFFLRALGSCGRRTADPAGRGRLPRGPRAPFGAGVQNGSPDFARPGVPWLLPPPGPGSRGAPALVVPSRGGLGGASKAMGVP